MSVVGAPTVVIMMIIEDMMHWDLFVVDVVDWDGNLLVMDMVDGDVHLLVDWHWHMLHHRNVHLLHVVVVHGVHFVWNVDGVVLAVLGTESEIGQIGTSCGVAWRVCFFLFYELISCLNPASWQLLELAIKSHNYARITMN